MSYDFNMGFTQANSLQEAMAIALEYTQSQMTKENIKKTIRDNRFYIPSIRAGHIANEVSKNRRANVLADTADRYWLEALFTFRFLYWEEHKLLGIVMMPPEERNWKWPVGIHFQNSCDTDYPIFRWEEGNIPFFTNAVAKAKNYTEEEIRARFDYEIDGENLEYYRRRVCYDDIFEALALDPWLYNHYADMPFVTFALQGIQNETERYLYLQWLKTEIQNMIPNLGKSVSPVPFDELLDIAHKLDRLAFDDDPYEYRDNEGVESITDIAEGLLDPAYRMNVIKFWQDKREYWVDSDVDYARVAERAKDILGDIAKIFGSEEQKI